MSQPSAHLGANEVFAYFCRFEGVNAEKILKKIKMKNISEIKQETIKIEIDDGYRRFAR